MRLRSNYQFSRSGSERPCQDVHYGFGSSDQLGENVDTGTEGVPGTFLLPGLLQVKLGEREQPQGSCSQKDQSKPGYPACCP